MDHITSKVQLLVFLPTRKLVEHILALLLLDENMPQPEGSNANKGSHGSLR